MSYIKNYYYADILAQSVRESDTYDEETITAIDELACLAGLDDEWRNADGDNFEDVIRKIQNVLNVDCGL